MMPVNLVGTIMTEWRTNIREAGQLLPEAIILRVPSAPLGYVRQLCKKQRVLLGDRHGEANHRVQHQDRIAIKPSARWLEFLQLSPVQPAEILYEDTECLVINKPCGLAVHNARGHDDDLRSRLEDFLVLRGESFRVAPIHRLDASTSGAVLFGKGKKTAGQLGQILMAGNITKRYLAVVEGLVGEHGELTTPVQAKGRIQPALTRFRRLDDNGRASLVELELITGRRHQIRQQLAAAGWPIIGDQRYHHRSAAAGKRLLLHSCFLAFAHPISGRMVEIDCPPPDSFTREMARLGLDALRCRADRQNSTTLL